MFPPPALGSVSLTSEIPLDKQVKAGAATLLREEKTELSSALFLALNKLTSTTETRIEIITTTIRISISVNPCEVFLFLFIFGFFFFIKIKRD